jgi:hypothetical protein
LHILTFFYFILVSNTFLQYEQEYEALIQKSDTETCSFSDRRKRLLHEYANMTVVDTNCEEFTRDIEASFDSASKFKEFNNTGHTRRTKFESALDLLIRSYNGELRPLEERNGVLQDMPNGLASVVAKKTTNFAFLALFTICGHKTKMRYSPVVNHRRGNQDKLFDTSAFRRSLVDAYQTGCDANLIGRKVVILPYAYEESRVGTYVSSMLYAPYTNDEQETFTSASFDLYTPGKKYERRAIAATTNNTNRTLVLLDKCEYLNKNTVWFSKNTHCAHLWELIFSSVNEIDTEQHLEEFIMKLNLPPCLLSRSPDGKL